MTKSFFAGLLASSILTVAVTARAGDDATHQPQSIPHYSYATGGVLDKIEGGWKLLLDESNLGGKELELAEVTIPAGTKVGSHTHESLEVIYVLSGTYGHEVNGHYYLLNPGMVGVVRPGDHVRHIVPKDGDTKLLVMWTPGGEIPFKASQGTVIKRLSEVKAPQ